MVFGEQIRGDFESGIVAQSMGIVAIVVALDDLEEALSGLLPTAVDGKKRIAVIGNETGDALAELKVVIKSSDQHKTTVR